MHFFSSSDSWGNWVKDSTYKAIVLTPNFRELRLLPSVISICNQTPSLKESRKKINVATKEKSRHFPMYKALCCQLYNSFPSTHFRPLFAYISSMYLFNLDKLSSVTGMIVSSNAFLHHWQCISCNIRQIEPWTCLQDKPTIFICKSVLFHFPKHLILKSCGTGSFPCDLEDAILFYFTNNTEYSMCIYVL